jgi:hypothetical protein
MFMFGRGENLSGGLERAWKRMVGGGRWTWFILKKRGVIFEVDFIGYNRGIWNFYGR